MTINGISYGSAQPAGTRTRGAQSRAYQQAPSNHNHNKTAEAVMHQNASATSQNTNRPDQPTTNHYELERILERGALHEQRVQKLQFTYGQKRAVNAYHEQHLMSRREEVKNMMGFEAYA